MFSHSVVLLATLAGSCVGTYIEYPGTPEKQKLAHFSYRTVTIMSCFCTKVQFMVIAPHRKLFSFWIWGNIVGEENPENCTNVQLDLLY